MSPKKPCCRLSALLITHPGSSSLSFRDPGVVPVEKKKKAKRRKQELAVQEGAESDDTSMSALTMGGEDSQDPLDNAVSGPGGGGVAGGELHDASSLQMMMMMMYVQSGGEHSLCAPLR